MAGSRDSLTISDLEARTGVPRSTIHSYLRRGVLPPATVREGNRFLYGDRHVRGLRLIRLLRARRNTSLASIRQVLPELLEREEEEAFRPELWDHVLGSHADAAEPTPGDRLLRSAADLFSTQGFGETNVDQICDAAGIAKGSLYRHHRSKTELFFAVAEHVAAEVDDALGRAARGGTLDASEAVRVVRAVLSHRLSIILDLASGALQGRPGYATAVVDTVDAIGRAIGERLDQPTAEDAGRRILAVAALEAATDGLQVGRVRTPLRQA